MLKPFFLILYFFAIAINASVVERDSWPKGESFLSFLEKNSIPQSLYWDLDKEDKELCEEIRAGVTYYTMYDENRSIIKQVLIPLNEELQIHLKRKEDGSYSFGMTPIAYKEYTEAFSIFIEHSPYQDIIKATNNPLLAYAFVDAFKNSFDFTRLRKGDKIAIFYRKRIRLGKVHGTPVIEAALIESRKKSYYLFRYNDRYYDSRGREIEGFVFRKPVNKVRITSKFTLRRYHPVLKRYRAHLGVDFGGRTGTPVMAAADGKVIFAGRQGGYGNVIKIRHRDGFMTLYAHLHKFRKGIRRGKYVKKGQVIGYIGSTGMSTGPHLHFGLYKNGRPINPLGVIKVAKKTIYGKERKRFLRLAKKRKEILQSALNSGQSPGKLQEITEFMVPFERETRIGG